MATITGLTAERMEEIEAASIVDGNIVGDNLILVKHDASTINAGNVRGIQGIQGPAGATGPGVPTTKVSTFPGSPTLGQRCLFQTAAMLALTRPVMWECVYDGAKWVPNPIPLYAEVATNTTLDAPDNNTSSTTYGNLTTGSQLSGPDIAIPVIGVYLVEIGFTGYCNAANSPAMSYAIGATAAVDADAVRFQAGVTNMDIHTVSKEREKTLNAVTLASKYKVTVATQATIRGSRWMKVTPLRLG